MNNYILVLVIAIIGFIIGYCGEGNNPIKTPAEKFSQILKWISVIVLGIYVLAIVAALTDGIGDVPLLGGGYIWVRGHWRRR